MARILSSTITIIFYILCAVLALATLIISGIQAINVTKTDLGELKNADGSDDSPCSNGVYAEHRPLRFMISGDTKNLECGWPPSNQALRFVTCIVSLIFCIVGILCVVKRKKVALYACIILSGLFAIAFFAAMCFDANSVRISYMWCTGGLEGVQKSDDLSYECNYITYAGMTGLDVLGCLFWIVTLILTFRHVRRHMSDDHHSRLDDENYREPTFDELMKKNQDQATAY
eukprot:TRINITY_DN19409_c0_g1_i1.p1 TRINITY_DN19409_c0_g1~~TRINITY_DN19409_c0_g1_i1.p1  ORF type:complete len:230 (-),score=41.69 TRINITY_DN19409_c0_g1_i1:49-738(-)